MIRSKIAISSKNYYSCEITEKIPLKISILAINGPEGLGTIEALDRKEETLKEYVSQMKQSEQIVNIEITHRTPHIYWNKVKHRLDYPSIHETILESGSMTILPIVIENGVQYHNILSPSSTNFRNLLSKLKKRYTDINIRALSSKPTETVQDLLTDKQFETLMLAYKRGYYEIPHRCTIADIADELGIKRVACQERIRRAEQRIIDYYVKTSLFSIYGFY
ncbi:MAG: hypothetical protein HGN29_08590 [Asgard group archaeon]|nr:hypothetical protein [Asgard group archaeon]